MIIFITVDSRSSRDGSIREAFILAISASDNTFATIERLAATDLYRTSRSLTEALIRLRPIFNNDLDQLVMYLVFLLGPLHQEAGGVSREQTSRQGLNALSISQITGIARESTRRKLRGLARAGFVDSGPDGLWRQEGSFGIESLHAELRPLIDTLAKITPTSIPGGSSQAWDRRQKNISHFPERRKIRRIA
jgi:hypothetical protein